MSRVATVLPADGLNLREAPDKRAAIRALLDQGVQVTITAASGEWRRVETPFGPGFVHGDFITVDGQLTVSEEPPGLDPLIPDAELDGDDRAGIPKPAFYTVLPGDTLSSIGTKTGHAWREIAAINGIPDPFVIQPNQVLRLPGPVVRAGLIEILNPLEWTGETLVTSSSAQGHHVPYGGSRSCDLDIIGGDSRGVAVRFNVSAPEGMKVRGVVFIIGPACRSGNLGDGGSKVQLRIQHRRGGAWQDSGAWVLYGHLDPVLVDIDQVVEPGTIVGRMGPASGPEYMSSCAQGSHVHVEATNASGVVDLGSRIGATSVISITA